MKPPAVNSKNFHLFSPLAGCLFLVLITAAAFWPVRHHDFVNYDDYRYVVENERVKAGLTRSGIQWAFTNLEAGFWHPLTWLSHMLDCEFYGLNAKGHHGTNLLFHIANTLLLFLVLRKMTGATWRSWAVAALFALHPLHVESVAWVSERKDVLSTLFWMTTLWAYVRYVESPGMGRYLAVFVFLALGLMAKSMVATLPFVLLLLDYWPLGRIGTGGRDRTFTPERAPTVSGKARRDPLLRVIMEKIPLMILSASSIAVTFYAEQGVGALSSQDAVPLSTRIANALVSYVVYLGKMFWPRDLSVIYPYPLELPGWQVAGSVALLVSLSALALLGARRRPYLLVGWLWYLGTLVPVIGLVKIGSHAMADRYTYVPLIGLLLMVVWGVPRVLSQRPYRRVSLVFSGGAVLSVLAVATWFQVQHWGSSRTLFEHALRVTESNFLAHKNLGVVLSREGKLQEAEGHLRESLRIHPGYASARFHLANVLALQGRPAEAIEHYAGVIEQRPTYARPYYCMGNIFLGQGRLEEAVLNYSKALELDPDDGSAHNNLGLALLRQGKHDRALDHFSEALRINPKDTKARHNLELIRREPGQNAGG